MRVKGFFVFLLIIFCDYASFAQRQGELTQSRILILLDESSSMIQSWAGGRPKYKAADELIIKLMDSIYSVNNQVEFSLRVFGHQHTVAENNCYDTKNEVAFSRDNRTQMAYRLADIHPLGVTPIAYSLEQAAEYDLIDEQHNAYSIILITDGGESCNGNICEVMKKLLKNKVYFKPYIVSLEDDPTLKVTYSCMGDYLQVTKDGDIPKAVGTIVEAFRPIIKITATEYKQMQTIAANTPSVLKVNVPIIKAAQPVDTVKAEPKPEPPKPEHKIKVDDTPQPRPAAEKIVRVDPAHLNRIFINPPRQAALNTTNGTPALPPLVDVPPPVVKSAPEKITRIAPAGLKNFSIYTDYSSAAPLRPVEPGKLPPLVIETPLPPPEKISLATPARTKKLNTDIPEAVSLNTVKAPSLPPLVMEIPAPPPPVVIKIPPPEKISHATPAGKKKLNTDIPEAVSLNSVKTLSLPPLVMDIPAPPPPVVIKAPQPENISRTTPARPKKLNIDIAMAAAMKTRTPPSLPALVFDIPVPPAPVAIEKPKPVAEKIARLKPARLSSVNVVFVIEERTYVQRRTPELPPIKFDIAKLPAGKTQIPITATLGKKMEYKIDVEDAKETSVEVYITNGKGKFYTTTPQVALVDPATKKVVRQFYRTVDPNGEPDLQTNIPVGTYNVTFPAKKNLVINNVHVEQNKKNKIIVTVKNVSLSFAYLGAPDRPVKEFGARVIERDKAKGRVQDQLCTATLEYEPGNYHIRINTFPEDVRNVDLDLDEEYVLQILQPGFVKFTSDTKQVVTLWKEDGNKFVPFHQLDLNDPQSQHKQIQPGKYQVHYHKGPGGSAASEKVQLFIIKSNETTEVIL